MITVSQFCYNWPTPQITYPTTYIQPWITTTTTVADPRVEELEDRVAALEHELLANRLGFRLPEGVQVEVESDGAAAVALAADCALSEAEWEQIGEYVAALRGRRLRQNPTA